MFCVPKLPPHYGLGTLQETPLQVQGNTYTCENVPAPRKGHFHQFIRSLALPAPAAPASLQEYRSHGRPSTGISGRKPSKNTNRRWKPFRRHPGPGIPAHNHHRKPPG